MTVPEPIKISTKTLLVVLLLIISGCGGGGGGQKEDPVILDLPIAYIVRAIPVDEDDGEPIPSDVKEPNSFNPGANLFLRDRAAPGAPETQLTIDVFPDADNPELYDVKDLSASADGSKLVFAMRAPEIENADEDEQPTWNIWEYDLTTELLRRVISSDIVAEEGDDISPQYLVDGKIVFSSNRQRETRAKLLDENKPQFSGLDEDRQDPAFVLHTMDPDGTNIDQITFNQSHDLNPTVLLDGRVLFSRWDNVAGNDAISLYTVNPDGSNLAYLYGFHSQDTGTEDSTVRFVQPREMPDGRILVIHRADEVLSLGGDIVAVDVLNFTDVDQAANGGTGTVSQQSLSIFDVTTDGSTSQHGHFSAAYPLQDGTDRLLVSWSQCRLQEAPATDPDGNPIILPTEQAPTIVPCTEENLADETLVDARPLYGIWVYDPIAENQLPVLQPEENIMYTEVVALEPKELQSFIPPLIGDVNASQELIDDDMGVLHIRSVYDIDGFDTSPTGIENLRDPAQTIATQRPARFLKIVKAVPLPDDDLVNFNGGDFGRSTAQGMREILGYAPIEPDGSVKARIPANVPFAVTIVDEAGRRISERHQNWLQLKAGEEKECIGCHTAASEMPHGRVDAQALSINTGADLDGQPFINTEPGLIAQLGQTMAETLAWVNYQNNAGAEVLSYAEYLDNPTARVEGVPRLSPNLVYDDVWTDPAVRPKDASFAYEYTSVPVAPISNACQNNWSANCRILINYLFHIQPIWDQTPRMSTIVDGVTDDACINCHAPIDDMGAPMVPAAQLDLTPADDAQAQIRSYRELFFGDVEQEVVDGALVDRLIQQLDGNGNPVFQTDEDGNLILDAMGQPIPVLVTVPVRNTMSTAGAFASARFFAPFQAGGTHFGVLDPAELKLLYEWLDIGAQYYNNPFDVPQ